VRAYLCFEIGGGARLTDVVNVPRLYWQDLFFTEGISRLVARGDILRNTTNTEIILGELKFTVPITHRLFPSGGFWSFYVCECGRQVRFLMLHEGHPRCQYCCCKRGVADRRFSGGARKRLERTVEKLSAQLASTSSARLHPLNPGHTIDRRATLEISLRRAQVALRQLNLKRAGFDIDDGHGDSDPGDSSE
jgi:hypothetical protein